MNETSAVITASVTNEKIVFQTNVNSGYGDAYVASHISGVVGGVDLSASAWTFSSGVTGSHLRNLYNSVKDYYTLLASDADYQNQIVTRTATGWEFYYPSDGDVVFVKEDEEDRTYTAAESTWKPLSRTLTKGLTVTGSLTVTKDITKYGFASALRSATWSRAFSGSSLSGALIWDTFPRLDSDFYSGSRSRIRIKKGGDFKISYGVSWYQTGSATTGSTGLLAYIATSSYAGRGTGSALTILPASQNLGIIDGPPGGATRGSNSATFMASLNSNDILQLYIRHDYGTLPSVTTTVADQAWLLIEKV